MRWIKALAALMMLLALVVVPPVLLTAFVGNPLPPGVEFDTELTDETLIKLLSIVVWMLWAQTTWCVFAEAVAAARSNHLTRSRGTFGIQQHFIRILVGTIVAGMTAAPDLIGTPAVASLSSSVESPVASTQSVATEHSTNTGPEKSPAGSGAVVEDEVAAHSARSIVVVGRGDSLWSLAEERLGDGERWREIADLNEGRTMRDGHTFRSGDAIHPGWELLVPAAGQSANGIGSGDYTVKSGDTLSQIALDHVGDVDKWPELFKASKHLAQPVPLADPDLIYPGQRIDLPDDKSTPEGSDSQPGTASSGTDASPMSIRAIEGQTAANGIGKSRDVPEYVQSDSTLDTSQDETDDALPGWILPGLLGAGALLAGSLLLMLRCRRASQHRVRRPGRVVPAPDPTWAFAEKSVVAAGTTTASTMELVDVVLRRLVASLVATETPIPVLAAVEVTPSAVALHLKEVSRPPKRRWAITEDSLVWVIDKNTPLDLIGPDEPDSPAPWPLLVAIGHDDHEGSWFLNVEDLVVTVTGDSVAIADFARFIAAEIACNPWSRHTTLDVVGIAQEVAAMSPERIHVQDNAAAAAATGIAGAVRTIDRLAEYDTDTPTARAAQADPDAWPSQVIIMDRYESIDELSQLVRLIGDHRGRTATGMILRGQVDSQGFDVHIDERRELTIPAVNLTLHAVGLTAEETHGCAALLAQADKQADEPAPTLDGNEAWKEMATGTGSLRNQYRVSRSATTQEPSVSTLEESDLDYISAAATTSDDLETLAPKVPASVRDDVADADPTLDTDLEAWNSGSDRRPRLALLGPVAARTFGAALAGRKPFYIELFAYLATRPHGATTDEVATAFDLTPSRVRVDINKLRDWLGTNPATGHKFIPDARDAPSARHRGVGVYEVVDALVDVDLFRRLRLRGETRGPEGIEDLVCALQLVSGRPFENLRRTGWGWLLEGDRLDQHMVCAIADVAHLVVTHSLQSGNCERAQMAVEIAMMAAPEEEVVRLDHAAVLEAQGHHAQAERVLRDDICNRSDDGEAPTDLPERTDRIIDWRRWLQSSAG